MPSEILVPGLEGIEVLEIKVGALNGSLHLVGGVRTKWHGQNAFVFSFSNNNVFLDLLGFRVWVKVKVRFIQSITYLS